MNEREKPKDELILELQRLRNRVAELEQREARFTPEREEAPKAAQTIPPEVEGLTDDERLSEFLHADEPSETIDLSSLFSAEVNDSGSFSIRGDIWKTTFGKMMQALPIPAFLLDTLHRIAAANESCRRWTRDYQKLLGHCFMDLFPPGAMTDSVRFTVDEVFRDRRARQTEAVLRINSRKHWIRMTLRSIRIMEDRFLLTLMEDLTEEKEQLIINQRHRVALEKEVAERKKSEEALAESEARFRRLYAEAPMMMVCFDRSGMVRSANQRLMKELGFSEADIVGKPVDSLVTLESKPALKAVMGGLSRDCVVRDAPLRWVRRDGSVMDVILDSVLIDDPLWGEVGLTVARDVTNELLLEKQLREAQKMEAVGTLAGGIAHDFNNLLQIILGYSDLLMLRTERQAPIFQGVRAIREAAGRGSELVNQILTFSRRVETDPRPVDLNQEVKQAIRLLKRTIPKMIEISFHPGSDVKPIFADPTQVEQVLLNLAVNAKDAMPRGGTLSFATRPAVLDEEYCRRWPEVQPGEYVLLTVTDNGQGMEETVLERIFEPFFTTKEPGEGSGLGLSTVFGIVKLHGGHITCHSEPGRGTTFEVYWPQAPTERIDSDSNTIGDMPAFGDETLLVVDDEDLVRAWAQDILSQNGYNVLAARNGREALELYQQDPSAIALVILDLNMPGMDGIRVLERLRVLNQNVRILIVSGFPMDRRNKEFLEQNHIGFFSKPLKVRDFLRAVRTAIDDKHAYPE